MRRLGELDPDAHRQLTNAFTYRFWFHKAAIMDDRFNRIYTIPQGYLDWGEKGIIVRCIYAVFMQQMIADSVIRSRDKVHLKHDAVRIRTQEWLKAQHFPGELIETFDSPASQ